MTRKELLDFLSRDWSSIRAQKEAYWANSGGLAGFEAGARLWQHARLIDPGWPNEAERQADLRHHIELAAKLQALSRALGSS